MGLEGLSSDNPMNFTATLNLPKANPFGAMGASLVGDFASGALNSIWAGAAEDKAWDRQKKILRNRHQWEMEDLRKAGLNPILTATKGFGGGGSSAVAMQQRSQPRLDVAAARKLHAETQLLTEQAKAVREKGLRDRAEMEIVGLRGDLLANQSKQAMADTALKWAQEALTRAGISGKEAESRMMVLEAKLYDALSEDFGELGAGSSARGIGAGLLRLLQTFIQSMRK